MAVDGAHVYWANFDTDTIGRANLDGTSVNQSYTVRVPSSCSPRRSRAVQPRVAMRTPRSRWWRKNRCRSFTDLAPMIQSMESRDTMTTGKAASASAGRDVSACPRASRNGRRKRRFAPAIGDCYEIPSRLPLTADPRIDDLLTTKSFEPWPVRLRGERRSVSAARSVHAQGASIDSAGGPPPGPRSATAAPVLTLAADTLMMRRQLLNLRSLAESHRPAPQVAWTLH